MDGKKIKSLRTGKGISLSKLSELTGISKSYLSLIERNIQKNPSLDILEKIAQSFDVKVEELVRREKQESKFSNQKPQVKSVLKVEIEFKEDQINCEKLKEIQELINKIHSG